MCVENCVVSLLLYIYDDMGDSMSMREKCRAPRIITTDVLLFVKSLFCTQKISYLHKTTHDGPDSL